MDFWQRHFTEEGDVQMHPHVNVKNVVVIGGGWSVTQTPLLSTDLRPYALVIGVNDAAIHARVHVAITMDRLWLENRAETLAFMNMPVHFRAGICKRIPETHNGVPFKNNNSMCEGMSAEPGTLFGNNSGACALNLAFKQGAPNVYLLGFDMQNGPQGQKHWYPPYPWSEGGGSSDGKLVQWSKEFAHFAQHFKQEGVTVKNVTTRTKLNNWPIIGWKHFMKEISNG